MTMTKLCRVCREEKPLDAFGVNRHIKGGVNSMCKACGVKQSAEYRERNYVPPAPRVSKRQPLSVFKAKQKEWRENNKQTIDQRVSAWAKAHPEKVVARTARYRAKFPNAGKEQYQKLKATNPAAIAEKCARRRAMEKNAYVTWANPFLISEIYKLANQRTKATGVPWEVDHFYPLQSDVVCGLHVESNLRVIPRSINRAKQNKVLEVTHG